LNEYKLDFPYDSEIKIIYISLFEQIFIVERKSRSRRFKNNFSKLIKNPENTKRLNMTQLLLIFFMQMILLTSVRQNAVRTSLNFPRLINKPLKTH